MQFPACVVSRRNRHPNLRALQRRSGRSSATLCRPAYRIPPAGLMAGYQAHHARVPIQTGYRRGPIPGVGGVMVDCSLPNLHVVQHTTRAMLDSPPSRRCVGVDDLLPRQQLTAVNRTAHAANAPRHGTRGALCSNCLACGWQSMNVTWTWHPRDLWLPSLLRIMRRIRRSC